nr:hypothetical protein HmN_000968900 [Hymenolepis microstoma]
MSGNSRDYMLYRVHNHEVYGRHVVGTVDHHHQTLKRVLELEFRHLSHADPDSHRHISHPNHGLDYDVTVDDESTDAEHQEMLEKG